MALDNLEDQVELLRQQLAELTGSDAELGMLMSLRHGITLQQATILHILVRRSPAVVSRQSLHMLFYGDLEDGGPELSIFAVQICRLRRILLRVGAKGKIETRWGMGYLANQELVRWVKERYTRLNKGD